MRYHDTTYECQSIKAPQGWADCVCSWRSIEGRELTCRSRRRSRRRTDGPRARPVGAGYAAGDPRGVNLGHAAHGLRGNRLHGVEERAEGANGVGGAPQCEPRRACRAEIAVAVETPLSPAASALRSSLAQNAPPDALDLSREALGGFLSFAEKDFSWRSL